MIQAIRCTFVALPLSLLLAGCSGNDRAEFRPASATALPARTTHAVANGGIDGRVSSGGARPASRPAGVLGYVAPSDPRYGITLDEMRADVRNQTAVIIDARGPADFALGHVRGAFNMPAGQKEAYMVSSVKALRRGSSSSFTAMARIAIQAIWCTSTSPPKALPTCGSSSPAGRRSPR